MVIKVVNCEELFDLEFLLGEALGDLQQVDLVLLADLAHLHPQLALFNLLRAEERFSILFEHLALLLRLRLKVLHKLRVLGAEELSSV